MAWPPWSIAKFEGTASRSVGTQPSTITSLVLPRHGLLGFLDGHIVVPPASELDVTDGWLLG